MGVDAPVAAHTTVFTILLENHDYKEVIGATNAPYINQTLLHDGVLATNYKDSGTHPSLPNYLVLTSGAPQYNGFGIYDSAPTTYPFPVDTPNLGAQLDTAGIKWRAYEEGMGTACNLSDTGNYAAKHNPFVYYNDMQTNSTRCQNADVDYTQFAGDLAAGTYQYMWITPNLLDDGHDPQSDPATGLAQTDTWLSTEVPKILASQAYQHGGILFITWDEAEGRNGDDPDQVPMIVLSPKLKAPGTTDGTAWSHMSYLATVEDLFSMPRLQTVMMASSMSSLFQ